MLEQIGQTVGQLFQAGAEAAAADPRGVGAVALSGVAAVSAGGLAWWRKKRPREGRSVVRAEVPAGQRLCVDVGARDEPKRA